MNFGGARVSDQIPTWDGQSKGWRRYCKEVAWYVQGTKKGERRYLATRLQQKLTGSARLLAMSWNLAEFDCDQGVHVYLQKLAASPLVRRSLPNAAAIMTQYFQFRRGYHESISSFACLVWIWMYITISLRNNRTHFKHDPYDILAQLKGLESLATLFGDNQTPIESIYIFLPFGRQPLLQPTKRLTRANKVRLN